VVYKETGPVTFRFFIEGHEFASTTLSSPGPQHLEFPAPMSLLTAALPMQVKVTADKYLTGSDGVKMAYLLVGGGFKQ
jgi:hypothetical protein